MPVFVNMTFNDKFTDIVSRVICFKFCAALLFFTSFNKEKVNNGLFYFVGPFHFLPGFTLVEQQSPQESVFTV